MLSCRLHVMPSLLILHNRNLAMVGALEICPYPDQNLHQNLHQLSIFALQTLLNRHLALVGALGFSLLIHPDRHLRQRPDLHQLSILALQTLLERFLWHPDQHQLSIPGPRLAVLRYLPQQLPLLYPLPRLSVARHRQRQLLQHPLPRLGRLACVLRQTLAFQHGSQECQSHSLHQLP
jgi:hypothetical protein